MISLIFVDLFSVLHLKALLKNMSPAQAHARTHTHTHKNTKNHIEKAEKETSIQ